MNGKDIFNNEDIVDDSIVVYEGDEPYIFISYSHHDVSNIKDVINVLQKNNIRYWYDKDLQSGDDVNLKLATHLVKASAFLLLLSKESAKSINVKNEINFASNHRIPMHILLTEKFAIPVDIELIIGRIKIITKTIGYERKLLEALPSELYSTFDYKQIQTKSIIKEHQLFEMNGSEIMNRQGTISYIGKHRVLGYEILIQVDSIINANYEAIEDKIKIIGKVNHHLFP